MNIPRLPSNLTYNDLNGLEAVEIMTDWFKQLLLSQPWAQRHITLPMAKMTIDVGVAIDMYIGGTVPVASPPERVDVTGAFTLENKAMVSGPNVWSRAGGEDEAKAESSPVFAAAFGASGDKEGPVRLSTVVNAAPTDNGVPPDQLREQHDLPRPTPSYGPRETGSHLFLSDTPGIPFRADVPAPPPPPRSPHLAIPQREGVVAEGYVFSTEPVPSPGSMLEQTIRLDERGRGKIEINLSGDGKVHQGNNVVSIGPVNNASVKDFGDQRGHEYGSVTGVMDAGPAGLARGGGQRGLYGDGRSRITFGNSNRG